VAWSFQPGTQPIYSTGCLDYKRSTLYYDVYSYCLHLLQVAVVRKQYFNEWHMPLITTDQLS